ncbi:MAG: radical SAM family heme chaperone HemW [Candidatus Eremiobacteraeota bacterium]|nr:radical SAM family heme chaperone HemW [Candidatus Eremiobacteraeota bacterium]MBV8459603.1 radical SAM family heme chaperone HemW [Candidatus Eremiobacteraeota bacterium]MBV8595038.1 radical SAM family heme chaperone HemW [Candidatus Eremiobacteraeota bacterium]MBV8669253.1 radical SAM family heme chaperone HemW [Candidatus Eremiobacteraeota bacterium]MBV8670560.1 radical SAM family heme chaperone HemW [Candidatus Eremiobacteraeota bacterium]
MNGPHWLERTTDAGLGCYVHVPFCDRICPYCDFAVVRYEGAQLQRYLTALIQEVASSSREGPLQTLYIGGGTPSALPRASVQLLLATLFTRFRTEPGTIECTLEANPGRNEADLGSWRCAGVNRLSIGVQSFDDAELHRLGRAHTGAQAMAFYEAARGAGFTNVSLDLIAGVPGQTVDAFAQNLATAIRLDPDHVSIYGLQVEEGTPYARWRRRDPRAFCGDDMLAAMLECADATLTAAGYVHYEISNFAKPGFESAHNTGYWRQRDCVAFGMSAAGYEQGLRYRNIRDLEGYCAAIERAGSARCEEEHLEPEARLGEAAMLALRTSRGIDAQDFERRFGVLITDVFAHAARRCIAAGLLEQDRSGMRLTARGRLLANSVCAEFLEPQQTHVVTH